MHLPRPARWRAFASSDYRPFQAIAIGQAFTASYASDALFVPLLLLLGAPAALVVAVGAELWGRRQQQRFHLYAFACAVGFFLSFLGYLVVPAVGPRFTLYDVATVERELPGLWLTPALRAFVDGGGLVPPGLSKDAAMLLAPRDVFPSGHTMLTLVAIFWGWRFGLRIKWAVSVAGGLLVLGTVYLRYHYAIDLIAAAALAALATAATPALHRWLTDRLGASG